MGVSGAKDDDAVVVVDTGSWSVVERITAPGIVEPHGSAISADGRYLFVSNRNQKGTYGSGPEVGTVVKIATRSLEVVATIEVGAEPYGIVAVFDDKYGNGWDLLQPTD